MSEVFIGVIGVSMALAIGIGSNDETMAPVYGSRKLGLLQSVVLGGLLAWIGAVLLGGGVSDTVGKKLSGIEFTDQVIIAILISAAICLILASWQGAPISTTQAVVGAVVFLGLYKEQADGVEWDVFGYIVLSWIISPLIGMVIAYIVMRIVNSLLQKHVKGYNEREKADSMLSWLLLVFVAVTAISRGANDVANAVAPLAGSEGFDENMRWYLAMGGAGMFIGVITLGRKVVKTLADEIVELTPASAFSVQLATAITIFVGTLMGLPLSGTHILVFGFIGVGLALKEKLNFKTVNKILISWVVTMPIAGLMCIGCYEIIGLF
ncbi:MAG: anion permease [Candidatus Heimdallarchaeota archaeon]|nr:anion permease [Candidatus Heimdallarchaeota archaeon]MCK5048375.1 anion permease [Candidatus Heimdallarchaeota archaeon]